MNHPHIGSEIGPLTRVLVHRPGLEVARLTPDNKKGLLFDDLLWLERAQEEHDRFAGLLRDSGAEVLYFEQLLADILDDEDLRAMVIQESVTAARCGTRVAQYLGRALLEAPTQRVVDVLIGGILERELEEWGVDRLFARVVADRFNYILRPLPNLLFMRDNAAWVGDGVVLSVLRHPARERESLYMRFIYEHHPLFRDMEFPIWFGGDPEDRYPASIEGGDILVLNEHTLVVGLGERTAPATVEILAERLFAASDVRNVIVVHLRKDRSVMHLDTVFTMVDIAKFNVFPGLLEGVEVHVMSRSVNGGLDVETADSLRAALTKALERDDLEFIPTGGDAIGRLREQWDDGNNTLAVSPGVVIAYQRNAETNRRLRDAGVTVLDLDSSELCRGRGGSRCMTQPLSRLPVSA